MERLKLDIQRFGASVSLTASETAVDETAIQNNQTYINLSIRVQTSKPTWNGNKTAYYQVTTTSQNEGTQTGSKYYFSIGSSTGSGDKTFTTTLGPFTHNADGTLNNVSISTYVKITDSTNRTGTASVAMATIPRASQPTISANPTLGSQITIYTNRVSSSFTHSIVYWFGNATGTIGTEVGDSVNWTPAITLAQQIPNATTGIGTITCYTYNGGAFVGSKSVSFTATVPGNITPGISLSNPTIGGSAPAGWGIFVKGKSTASYTITGTGNQGSTISQYQSSVAGYSYTTASVTTGILYSAGTQTISAKVIDSRGREATTSKTFNVVDYYNPSFTAVQIQRVDENGNLDDNGEFAYFHFAGSVSSCSGNNKGTFKIAYREHDTGSYTEKTIATNQESINQSGFITSDGTQSGTKIEFENTKTYDIKFMITDTFITVENLQQLDTGFDLLNWNPSGQSMAIGKVSEALPTEKKLEIAMDTDIDGDLNMTGRIYLGNNGIMNPDVAGYYTDRYGNLHHKRSTATDELQFYNGANDAIKARYFWEKGTFKIDGQLIGANESTWVKGRDIALAKQEGTAKTGWAPVICSKTLNGDWTLGTLPGANDLYFSYVTDADYNADQNNNNSFYITTSGFTSLKEDRWVLYQNDTGTNDVTLSQSASNFTYLEIWFHTNDGGQVQGYSKVYEPNNKMINLRYDWWVDGHVYVKSSVFTISGNKITQHAGCEYDFSNGSSMRLTTTSNISIIRVVGYKE